VSGYEQMRNSEVRRIAALVDQANAALQRTRVDSPMYPQIVTQRQQHLDAIARLERLDGEGLRQRYQPDPEALAAQAQQQDTFRRSPEVAEMRKAQIIREVAAGSAERQRRLELEARIAKARQEAADAAEAAIRAEAA
jgi:hypothetical protein